MHERSTHYQASQRIHREALLGTRFNQVVRGTEMISDEEMQAYRESMSADAAAEMARTYRAMAQHPTLSRPTDNETAETYQAIADRKRGTK